MPSIRGGARRPRSRRRCGVERLEDRRLMTVAFTSTDYVVAAGAEAAVIQVTLPPLGGTVDSKAGGQVELALYAEGADPAVDAPLARVPIASALAPSPMVPGAPIPPASSVFGQSPTVPLPAGASGSFALKLLGNEPLPGQLPQDIQHLQVDATLHVVDRADVAPPRLVSVRQVVRGRNVEGIEVAFSEPMDRAAAEDPANYAISASRSVMSPVKRPGTLGQQGANLVPISRASYDPATWTVTLTPARPLSSSPLNNLHDPADYQSSLTGRGTPSRLTDEAGNRLDSDGDGSPDGLLRTRGSMMAYGPAKVVPGRPANPPWARRSPPMGRTWNR